MSTIDSLRTLLAQSDAAMSQLIAHGKDRRLSRPPFDEWWGPEAVQEAASAALKALPALLAVASAAQEIISKRDLHWADAIEHRLEREQVLKAALAKLEGI